jgi:hypothetical protein
MKARSLLDFAFAHRGLSLKSYNLRPQGFWFIRIFSSRSSIEAACRLHPLEEIKERLLVDSIGGRGVHWALTLWIRLVERVHGKDRRARRAEVAGPMGDDGRPGRRGG